MKEGELHRVARRFDGAALADRRRSEMKHGFRHTVEHDADAHAGAEKHREPGRRREVGFGIVRAQLDRTHRAGGYADREDEKGGDRRNVEPAHLVDDPGLDGSEDRRGIVGIAGSEDKCGEDQRSRAEKDRRVRLKETRLFLFTHRHTQFSSR